MSVRKRLLHIHQCPSVSWHTLYRMLQFDSTLTSIFQMKQQALTTFFPQNPKQARQFYYELHAKEFTAIEQTFYEQGIQPICIFDSNYPALLKQIKQPPWVLYAKGKTSHLFTEKSISVVGTRFPTEYGKQTVEHLIAPLVQKGWTIVSGLAKGIDTLSHEIAIKHKGKTIAVLGSGFHYIYPAENKSLSEIIATEHLLLTEYPPETPPQKWHFPQRNRIISGLTKGTVVIEAKQRSGSLITAAQALDEGREVFAVPGSIFNINSKGTNVLIQEGAKLTMTSEDILMEF